MGHDNVKGRVMLAAKDLEPGEIVLEDPPLVAASWHRHRCLECHDLHDSSSCEHVCKNYPAVVTRKLARIEKFLEGLESIGELDSARRLIKLLNKCRNSAAVEKQTEPCTATNLDKCLASIKAIRAHATARHIIPEGMSDERAARLLGVLNANSHELEEWGGSGFYPRACLMEHSCAPNCTFNTSGTALWVTAIEPIAAGAAVSIDYTDSVFEPASARREHLLSAYGFTCTCAACSSQPDLNRAFLCPSCAATLCPRGLGLRPRDWQCVGCGRQVLRGERERFVRLEHALTEEPPESLDEVDEVLEHGVFAPTHFVVLGPLRALGELAAQDSQALADGTAESIWRRVVAGAQATLPRFHGQKALLLDCLAQVLVATGQQEAAKEAFRQSYEVTRVSAGEGTAPTLTAEALWRRPPASSAELQETYANAREQLAIVQRRDASA